MRPKVWGLVRHALPIVFGLTALAPLTSRAAVAQTIPSYGTHAHCQRLAGFGGTFSRSVYGSCLNVEQSAALALQGRWSSIPESVRERCDRADFSSSRSNTQLARAPMPAIAWNGTAATVTARVMSSSC